MEAQFLLDRLNSTSLESEQSAILDLMCQVKAPLPIDALMAILEDKETSSVFLRMGVAHTLARVRTEEAFDLFCSLLLDRDEHPWLREMMTGDLIAWGKRVPNEITLSLLANPDSSVCAAALSVLRSWPPDTIPLEIVLSYCTHKEKYIREEAIKTLLATELRAPQTPILSALSNPEPEVRAVASYGCNFLLEW